MRWRVGRSLTWRRRARTSCHGQPLRSSDRGSIGWASADTLLTTVTGRDSITLLFLTSLANSFHLQSYRPNSHVASASMGRLFPLGGPGEGPPPGGSGGISGML